MDCYDARGRFRVRLSSSIDQNVMKSLSKRGVCDFAAEFECYSPRLRRLETARKKHTFTSADEKGRQQAKFQKNKGTTKEQASNTSPTSTSTVKISEHFDCGIEMVTVGSASSARTTTTASPSS